MIEVLKDPHVVELLINSAYLIDVVALYWTIKVVFLLFKLWSTF